MKISQSFMKSFAEYKVKEECGLVVKAKYLDGIQSPPTKAMKLGQYFEFMATGGLPAYGDGTAPEPDSVYKGTAKERLSEDYERANQSAIFCKALFKAMNIKIFSFGKKLVSTKLNMSCTTDIIAKWNGKKCIIDLKYSGLVDDKWNELGWHEDFLEQKEKILTQAVHYKIIAKEKFKTDDVPFYFFVFNTKDPMDVRIFEVLVDPSKEMEHLEGVKNVSQALKREMKSPNGWKAYPELKRCNKCHLNETCEQRALLPKIKQVFY
jgi:hypothetical protein